LNEGVEEEIGECRKKEATEIKVMRRSPERVILLEGRRGKLEDN